MWQTNINLATAHLKLRLDTSTVTTVHYRCPLLNDLLVGTKDSEDFFTVAEYIGE